jgi:ribonuclease P protein component
MNCTFPAQFAFAAPKKIFPHAVDRNRLKRLMRESVRLQKNDFYQSLQEKNKQIIVLLSYQSKTMADFKTVDDAVTKLLEKMINVLD